MTSVPVHCPHVAVLCCAGLCCAVLCSVLVLLCWHCKVCNNEPEEHTCDVHIHICICATVSDVRRDDSDRVVMEGGPGVLPAAWQGGLGCHPFA